MFFQKTGTSCLVLSKKILCHTIASAGLPLKTANHCDLKVASSQAKIEEILPIIS